MACCEWQEGSREREGEEEEKRRKRRHLFPTFCFASFVLPPSLSYSLALFFAVCVAIKANNFKWDKKAAAKKRERERESEKIECATSWQVLLPSRSESGACCSSTVGGGRGGREGRRSKMNSWNCTVTQALHNLLAGLLSRLCANSFASQPASPLFPSATPCLGSLPLIVCLSQCSAKWRVASDASVTMSCNNKVQA